MYIIQLLILHPRIPLQKKKKKAVLGNSLIHKNACRRVKINLNAFLHPVKEIFHTTLSTIECPAHHRNKSEHIK